MLSDEQLRTIHREAVDTAMHHASERDGFGSNMSPKSIMAGLRGVEAAVRADQIERDAAILEANAGARTARQAFLIRAQLNGDSNAE